MLLLWLDDERTPPSSDWIWVKTAWDAIKALQTSYFNVVSLDHDLGKDAGEGYDVLLYIEEKVHLDPNYRAPEIRLHTANTSARIRMALAAESIERKIRESKSNS